MHSGMLVVEYMLADEGPGDGGVAVVQGCVKTALFSDFSLITIRSRLTLSRSHKTNYPAPTSLLSGVDWTQHVTEVHAKAGYVALG